MTKPTPLTAIEAKRLILEILQDGEIQPSRHCRLEKMPERGVQMADIRHALTTGEIKRAAEWDNEHSSWKYRVEGEDTEGDELTAITVIVTEAMRLVIVTVF